jgi:uncharacterized membrane protein
MWHGSEYIIGMDWGWLVLPVVVIFLIWLVFRITRPKARSSKIFKSSIEEIIEQRYTNGGISEKE